MRIQGRASHKFRSHQALCAAALAALGATASKAIAQQVTLVKNSSTNWTMTNGSGLSVVFDPAKQDCTSISFNGSPNLLNPSGTGTLDQEFAGTPFGSGTQTFNSVVGPNNSYVDVWTNTASTGTTVNPITYAFHYVLFAGDPSIHCYEVLNHASTDPATSVGQGQFLFRSNPALFPNLYQINTSPNQLGVGTSQTVASTNPNFSATSKVAGRSVQDTTFDLTGSGIAGDNGTNFFTKYDWSTYTQFYQAETAYGSQYAVSEIDPSSDSLTGGPTKQELAWTDPGILNMEFLSDHYGIDGSGTGAYPGYAYFPTQGQNTTRVFGPFAFRIASTTSETAAQINQDAVNSIANDQLLYASDTALTSAGYIPDTVRGSIQINASSTAGWSSNTANNTVVLSQPGVNMQESTQGNQYFGQLSQSGQVTISNVVPGTYRMTLYQLGQWGETRVDGVQVQNGQVSVPQNVKFTPENFSTAAPIWTIGTPDRSSHEFLNGHNASSADQRQYYGAYDFWGEEQALGNPGKVVYYATNVGSTPATNDPNKWIANQWYTFNPGLYDSSNGTTDNYTKTAPAYVTAGGGPANYHGSPWEVHFTATQSQLNQGQFVVISVSAAALNASLVISLNGHSETWSFNNFSGPDDPDTRSGDAGFTQWAAFQFPVADLNAAGVEDVLTLSPSAHTEGIMYDALRMEITNTSADPAVTGWHDYTYINGSSQTAPNDAVATRTLTWTNAGGTGDGASWDTVNQNWTTGVVSWSNSPNETTYAAGANVVFNDNNNTHYNVTLTSAVTPNSVLVNNSAGNYVFSGAGSITGSTGLAKYGTGSLTLNTVNSYTGGTVVNGGTLIVGVAGALPTNSSLTINSGGTVQLANNTGAANLSSLNITGTGVFDLANNHLFINYGAGPDPIASIAALIKSGYNGDTWTGPGIISSAAAANPSLYGVAFADSADPGNPAGLASGQIEVMYTLLGDANLDGKVNGSDFAILATNFNQSATSWDQGDFNYDNKVNGTDFADIGTNFNQASNGAISTEDFSALAEAFDLASNVPEPGIVALLGLSGAGLLTRRRNHTRSIR